jgi:hypothetical protein
LKNKLSYLSFLGLLGFGGFFGTPAIFGFFGFFGFLEYLKVVPDELFWSNVRTCATRSFFVFLVSSSVLLVGSLLLAANEYYELANMIITGGFGIILSVCVFTFVGGLVYLERKEKVRGDDAD